MKAQARYTTARHRRSPGITEAGLLKGHDYSGLKYSAKGKDVNEYDGAFSGKVVIKDAKGNDVTKNYEVTKTPGKLTITAYTDEVMRNYHRAQRRIRV